ncbi:hypothetical protein OOT46_24555 [Aquabacterium sp. A7-Y]|uniref:DUF1302 family protein n=1 Tax=Aquabacterium sp. A7-Y TaxID=1349605 RepID=UPI00223DDDAE|nr:DUF1302 family protein [Aquabacterium sp. A7-Y]MCW7540998.1 hypothetical protein [Aquabacterium sp. A7-Y]
MRYLPAATKCLYQAALVASLLSVPAPASRAQEGAVDWNGAIRANYFQSTRTLDDERDLLGATIQAKGSAELAENTVVKLEGRVTDAALNRPGKTDAELTAAYLALRHARWDWRIGKQVIAWGRADGINPTDVITPRDYTVLLPFDEDERLGSWAVHGTYAWTPTLDVSLVWKADFDASTPPMHRGDPPPYRTLRPGGRPTQVGFRVNRSGDDLDWSVSVYRGYSLLPHAGPSQGPLGAPIRLTYPVITMLGVDVAKNFSNIGTRLEAAYIKPDQELSSQQPGLRPSLFVVAGVDHTFFPRLNVNLQFFVRRSWQLPGRLTGKLASAQDFNRATFLQQARDVAGMTVRVSNAWLHDILKAEFFVQHYFRDRDTYLNPMLTYDFSDSLRGTVGGQYYIGSGPQFGPLKQNRGIFAELRYSF